MTKYLIAPTKPFSPAVSEKNPFQDTAFTEDMHPAIRHCFVPEEKKISTPTSVASRRGVFGPPS